MKLTINNKEQNLTFGIGFLRELDKIAPVIIKDIALGMGLQMKIPELLAGNLATLSDIVYCATFTNPSRPTRLEVDTFIETLPEDELDLLFDLIYEELEKSTAGKRAIKAIKIQQEKIH